MIMLLLVERLTPHHHHDQMMKKDNLISCMEGIIRDHLHFAVFVSSKRQRERESIALLLSLLFLLFLNLNKFTDTISQHKNEQTETSTSYYKEIPMSEILAINVGNTGSTSNGSYWFELKTAHVDYFCGEEGDSSWEEAVKQAYMPVNGSFTPTSGSAVIPASGTKAGSVIHHYNNNRTPGATLNTLDPHSHQNRGSSHHRHHRGTSERDIASQVQIFPDELLGSGQFGKVYGGVHRASGRAVAIKVIEKQRFPQKQEDQLKNEVVILQNLRCPGVVHLEKMFETPEQIFVVMEKLKGDMLDMILYHTEIGRLSERIARFLVYQVIISVFVMLFARAYFLGNLDPGFVIYEPQRDKLS